MMKVKPRLFIETICLVLILGISLSSTARSEGTLKVSVSIIPQKYFVKKIGGHLVDISVMVQPGANPATYEPRPQQMVKLTRSNVYFAIGVPFENVWLRRFSGTNPKMMIVHTEDGIEKIPMKAHLDHNEKRHSHNRIKDPHIWLSPPLVMIQARNILDGLLKIDPSNREMYEINYRNFIKELVDLDIKIRNLFLDGKRGTQFMVYHPAWGYFAKAYGLGQVPIEIEGKEPTSKGLKRLIKHAKKRKVKVIFIQPQFSTKNVNTIAKAIGAQVIFANPLDPNWDKNLLQVAEKFKMALR